MVHLKCQAVAACLWPCWTIVFHILSHLFASPILRVAGCISHGGRPIQRQCIGSRTQSGSRRTHPAACEQLAGRSRTAFNHCKGANRWRARLPIVCSSITLSICWTRSIGIAHLWHSLSIPGAVSCWTCRRPTKGSSGSSTRSNFRTVIVTQPLSREYLVTKRLWRSAEDSIGFWRAAASSGPFEPAGEATLWRPQAHGRRMFRRLALYAGGARQGLRNVY